MAWNTPATWVVSQVVGASDLNTQIRDNLNFLLNGKAQVNYRVASGAYTTTSAVFVLIDGTNLSATINVTTGRVKFEFGGFFSIANAGVSGDLDLFIDGADQGTIYHNVLNTSSWISYHIILSLAAGSHTIDLRWKTNGSTLSLAGSTGAGANVPICFNVFEL
jgi:hypothetical protein